MTRSTKLYLLLNHERFAMTLIPQLGTEERDLRGRTAIITGASSGIGRAAATLLAHRGAQLVLIGRDAARTADVATETGGIPYTVDFEDLNDVARLGSTLKKEIPNAHLFLNNAGAMFEEPNVTEDGFERTFQVNFLSSALLMLQLQELLERSGDDVRVISTGSSQAQHVGLDLPESARNLEGYSKNANYGAAKLALTLFTKHYDTLTGTAVSAMTVHPGFVATEIVRDNPAQLAAIRGGAFPPTLLTPLEGAEPLVAAGTAKSAKNLHGKFFNRYAEEPVSKLTATLPTASEIWEASVALLGTIRSF